MNDRPADISLDRSRWLEEAKRELRQMACTEACVSGLCAMCPAQEACLCESKPLPLRR